MPALTVLVLCICLQSLSTMAGRGPAHFTGGKVEARSGETARPGPQSWYEQPGLRSLTLENALTTPLLRLWNKLLAETAKCRFREVQATLPPSWSMTQPGSISLMATADSGVFPHPLFLVLEEGLHLLACSFQNFCSFRPAGQRQVNLHTHTRVRRHTCAHVHTCTRVMPFHL